MSDQPLPPVLNRLLESEVKVREAVMSAYAGLGQVFDARQLNFELSDDQGSLGLAGNPLAYVQNQGYGEGLPVYRTEQDLRLIRDRMRILGATNEFTLCALENRVNYVIGDGFKYSATPKDPCSDACRQSAARVQAVLDSWCEINDAPSLEAEALTRLDTEGEVFFRTFRDPSGTHHVRIVEPEYVTYPEGGPADPANSFGVRTEANDVETVKGYWVVERPQDGLLDPSKVSADKILHMKLNHRRGWKRGVSTFYPVERNLKRCEELLNSMSAVAKARAKIALIRKVTGLTTPAATAMLDKLTSIRVTDPSTSENINIERMRDGTVLTSSANTEYQFPPVQLGASDIVEVLQAELRAVASRLQMPEWMFTALADAKYSNAFVVEAPTLKSFRRLQRLLRNGFGLNRYGHRRSLIWRQLLDAVTAELITRDDLDNVTLGCEGPTLEARDRMQEVERHEKLVAGGFESKETAQRSLELDPDVEKPLIARDTVGKARPVTDATAVLTIQQAYIAGQLPRPAAAANLQILLGFTRDQAEALLPLDGAKKRTDDGQPPGGVGGPAGPGAPGGGADAGPAGGVAPAAGDGPGGAGAAPGGGQQPPDAGDNPQGDASAGLVAEAMKSLGVPESLRENKSGVFTDKAGHKYRLDNGVRVPLGEGHGPEAGGKDAPAQGEPHNEAKHGPAVPAPPPEAVAKVAAHLSIPPEEAAKKLAAAMQGGKSGGGTEDASSVAYPEGYKPPTPKSVPNPAASQETRPALEKGEARAVQAYSDAFYQDVNNALRGKAKWTPDAKDIHQELQAAMVKAKPFKPPVEVVRTIDIRDAGDLKKFISGMKAAQRSGEAVPMSGYVSTTTKTTGVFVGNIKMRIKAVHGLDAKPYSTNPEENELLLNHGSQFKVTKVTIDRLGDVQLELEQVPPATHSLTPEAAKEFAKKASAPAPAPAAGGFLGKLKSLFGGAK